MEGIMVERLGDAPIEKKYIKQMNELARLVDKFFNGDGPQETGFVMLVFPLEDHGGRCNYISNANREDVIVLLKEQLSRFEGMPEVIGHG